MSYDIQTLRRQVSAADIGSEAAALYHIFGMDYKKQGNLHHVDSETVAYVGGNCVIFENVYSGQKKYLMGLDERGVGCITVHPSG